MAGTFELLLIGDPRETDNADKLIESLRDRITQFAPDNRIKKYRFKRMRFRIVVTGVPENINVLDQLMVDVSRKIRVQFRRWEYILRMNYQERG